MLTCYKTPYPPYLFSDIILRLVYLTTSKCPHSRYIIITKLRQLLPSYEAGGHHDPPYTHEEEMAIVEAKKSDPASADEVFENIFVGNKAAAEDTQFLLRLTNQVCF